jgi:hypothetical protein
MEKQILTNELYDKYVQTAKDFAKLYNVESDHVIQIIASVMLHRDNLRPGGGFVESVVNNDLFMAVGKADPTCFANLKVIVASAKMCYVEN